jgi:hypothetical protein
MGFKFKINGGSLINDVHDTGSDNFYIATGLDPATRYCGQVEAVDDSIPPRESGYSSSVCETTDGLPSPPPTPNNVALASNGSTAIASSEIDPVTTPAAAVINGDRTAGTGFSSGNMWESDLDPASTPQWVEITFPSSKSISQVDVVGSPNFFGGIEPVLQGGATVYNPSDFKMQYWNGSAWVDIHSWVADSDWWRKFVFSPISTTKVRFYCTGTPGSAGRAYVVEVEAWETGKNPVNIIAAGNSRSQNTDYSWTRKLQWALNHNYSVKSVAIGGLDLSEILASVQMTDLADAYNPNASDNVVVMLDTVNDFAHSRALADVQADFVTFCAAVRALGYKLVVGSTAKATSTFISGANATNLLAFNTWLAANWNSMAHGYIDVASQPEFSDPDGGSSGYFLDHIHFSDTGGTVIGGLIAAVLDPWYTF